MFKKVFSALVTILFLGIGVMWLLDYNKVSSGLEPVFCLKKDVYVYDDGATNVCTGLGYKIFEYKRTNNTKTVVGPFWYELEK